MLVVWFAGSVTILLMARKGWFPMNIPKERLSTEVVLFHVAGAGQVRPSFVYKPSYVFKLIVSRGFGCQVIGAVLRECLISVITELPLNTTFGK